jgi:hypothetical protein
MTSLVEGKPNVCGYKIQPSELMCVESHMLKCPGCGEILEEMGGRKTLSSRSRCDDGHKALDSRVWRLPVRFSFAANKPEKSRKPSPPAPLCERQIRLGRISASSD